MYCATIFYQDPTNKKYNPRRVGSPKKQLDDAIKIIEKSKQEGYVTVLGQRVPIWHNVSSK